MDGQNKELTSYEHKETRVNAIPAGAATAYSDDLNEVTKYSYDPNIDPALEWAGKSEREEFSTPLVPLHIHEKMTTERVIRGVLSEDENHLQGDLFESREELLKKRHEALEAYRHKDSWSNRFIAGDSLIVMNSLLNKELMKGKVQCFYMDPPYGISFASNFQAFTGRRDVKDNRDSDIPSQPEMVKAFRDTWELGIHSYLTYIRDRLLLARELLNDTGSCFVQIGDENVHLVRCIMDEVFGRGNFVSQIVFRKTTSATASALGSVADYILWYARDKKQMKFYQLFTDKTKAGGLPPAQYTRIELADGTRRLATKEERAGKLPEGARLYTTGALTSQASSRAGQFPIQFKGREYTIESGSWKTNQEGIQNLIKANRIDNQGNSLRYIRYLDDFLAVALNNLWDEQLSEQNPIYVVQTTPKVISRCLLMTTDPGDLVLDPTCGSGTTAFVAEQWGRRWITIDTSRVALVLAEKRLSTAVFDYYKLKNSKDLTAGFIYKTVPHVTLKSIANNELPGSETLFDQPQKDNKKVRVAGPFTVESIPVPRIEPLVGSGDEDPTPLFKRKSEFDVPLWCEALQKNGLGLKDGARLRFSHVEITDKWGPFQATGTTDEENDRQVLIYFSDARHTQDLSSTAAALEYLMKQPDIPRVIIFAAFEFTPEAEQYLSESAQSLKERKGLTILHSLMNADLLTADLRRGGGDDLSFFMVGQPDVTLTALDGGLYQVEVKGFDYYNIEQDNITSGGKEKIALWMLDTDYDGLVIHPTQIFFPMDGNSTWKQVERALRAELDGEKIKAFKGCVSLPFQLDKDESKVAIKIVDDRGLESMRVLKRSDANGIA